MGKRGKDNTKWLTNVFPRLSEIREWCMAGKTNEEMCELLGIGADTWYRYIKEHDELNVLCSEGRAVINSRVENAVLKLAFGFEYTEIKTTIEENSNGNKRTRIEKMQRYMPPNNSAQTFWLRNRNRDEWGDRRELIIDTTLLETSRKQIFLNMINDKAIDTSYEVQETVDKGFEIEDSFDSESVDSNEPLSPFNP